MLSQTGAHFLTTRTAINAQERTTMTNPTDKAIEVAAEALLAAEWEAVGTMPEDAAMIARSIMGGISDDSADDARVARLAARAAIAAYERTREQGGVSEPSAPSEWQKRGPDFNEWEIEWERFAAMLADAKGEYFWVCDGALKYLNIRLDTRSNAFILRDRDDNRIDPSRVEAAIQQCRDMLGGVVKIDRDGRRRTFESGFLPPVDIPGSD